jgi:hypothetical protein
MKWKTQIILVKRTKEGPQPILSKQTKSKPGNNSFMLRIPEETEPGSYYIRIIISTFDTDNLGSLSDPFFISRNQNLYTVRLEENLPSKQENKTVSLAQSQGKPKLIFQKPNSEKQYYLTIGDQIYFESYQKMNNYHHAKIAGMNSAKNEIILIGEKDTIDGQEWVPTRTKDTIVGKQWFQPMGYFRQVIRTYPGGVKAPVTEWYQPQGYSENIHKSITVPAHYGPIHKSIIGTYTIDLSKVYNIVCDHVQKVNSPKEFEKRFDLRIWKKKWVVKIEN